MDTLKVLGQIMPAANTLVDLYTVPAATQAAISSLVVCNQNTSTGINFKISVAIAGAGDDPSQYIYFATPLDINDTFIATVGISLGAGDVVRCLSTSANVSFNLFGTELT